MTKIFLLGSANADNINRGCVALTLGALNILDKKYKIGSYTVIDLSTPSKTVNYKYSINNKEISVKTIFCDKYDYYKAIFSWCKYILFKKTNNKIINSLLSADVIYNINLGDSFTDIYGIKRLLINFIVSLMSILLGKSLIFLPQTIGPFNTIRGKILSFIILKNSKKIYIRDKMALKYLHSIGINPIETFDLSVYMPPEKIDMKIPENTIGINISGLLKYKTDLSKKESGKYDIYNDLITMLIQQLLKRYDNILLIPHTYSTDNSEINDDLKASKEIKSQIKSDKIKIIDKYYTAPQLKYIISQCDFFIGSRMHACFAALSTSTPVIGLGYSYKFEGGFNMFNIKECAISIKNLTKNQIPIVINKISELIDNKSIIKDKLLQVNQNMEMLKL